MYQLYSPLYIWRNLHFARGENQFGIADRLGRYWLSKEWLTINDERQHQQAWKGSNILFVQRSIKQVIPVSLYSRGGQALRRCQGLVQVRNTAAPLRVGAEKCSMNMTLWRFLSTLGHFPRRDLPFWRCRLYCLSFLLRMLNFGNIYPAKVTSMPYL